MVKKIFGGIVIIIVPILCITIGTNYLIKSIKAISTDDLDLMIKMANSAVKKSPYARKDEKIVRKYGIKMAIGMYIFLIVVGIGCIYVFYTIGLYNSTLFFL